MKMKRGREKRAKGTGEGREYIYGKHGVYTASAYGGTERERESKLTQRKKTRLTAMDSKLIRDRKRRTGGI